MNVSKKIFMHAVLVHVIFQNFKNCLTIFKILNFWIIFFIHVLNTIKKFFTNMVFFMLHFLLLGTFSCYFWKYIYKYLNCDIKLKVCVKYWNLLSEQLFCRQHIDSTFQSICLHPPRGHKTGRVHRADSFGPLFWAGIGRDWGI
jgi:hypothetical protein